ncbi:MAG: DUF4442 domain-containing protein [Gammaproteobacteria bacterium]|nr:DUF4442 domain-containing protein [Gammaproteobacteria bacterium]|tara:strand:+ start:782 stop:1261 length:480 start_codon:yes stop_codon:yes gene_type:complete
MFSKNTKLTWMVKLFGLSKVPMIYYCKPKVIQFNNELLEIKIPLNRRTQNHLNSMYFGALAVGADVTGGFLALPAIQKSKRKINLLFKDFNAKFLKRAEADVHFICQDGIAVNNLVQQAIATKERQNYTLKIIAKTPSISDDIVAEFDLTLSIKDYSNL